MWLLASNICHRRHYVTHFLPDRWPYGTERLSEWVNWIRRGRVANELPARANWVQFVSIIAHSRSGCVNGRSVGGGQTINIVSVLFILCKFLFIVRLMLRLFVFVVKFFFFFLLSLWHCHCGTHPQTRYQRPHSALIEHRLNGRCGLEWDAAYIIDNANIAGATTHHNTTIFTNKLW